MALLGQIILVLIPISILFWNNALHKIDEGYVGVYFRGGALLYETSGPGYHLSMPFVTQMEQVQTSVQTDEVTNIPCGTSGGVVIFFEKIEVVNRLNPSMVYETIRNYTVNYDKTWIFDKIHHEINQFCSKNTLQDVYIDKFDTLDENLMESLSSNLEFWAPGIEIISVRVTKPSIPSNLLKNYEAREAERTKYMIAVEQQKVKEKQAETKKREAIIQSEQEAEVSKIEMQRRIAEKEAEKTIALIEVEKETERRRQEVNSWYYQATKEIEANEKKLTQAYLKKHMIDALANNTKFYFGESIPKYLSTNLKLLDEE